MTSEERGREGIGQFLTIGREDKGIWYGQRGGGLKSRNLSCRYLLTAPNIKQIQWKYVNIAQNALITHRNTVAVSRCRCLALPSIPTSRAAMRNGTLRYTPLPGTSQKVANCSITHKLMSVYDAEVTQQRQRARSGGKGERERERSLAEGTKLIRPASVLPMRPLHATAAAANVAAVLNAVLPSPPSSSPSSAQSAAALPLQNQPCLRRLSVVMLVQIARRGTREGGREEDTLWDAWEGTN